MASFQDGKISKQLLKAKSGEFDLTSIHSVSFHNSDIDDLGCISECESLQYLDVSKNDITKLYGLAGLTNLTHLNLSANRISSLEGLQSLDNLQSLNLSGNLIGSVDDLNCLVGLEHLENLRLQDSIKQLKNPICLSTTYKTDITALLPKLKVLDGEHLSGKGSEFFQICSEMDSLIAKKKLLRNVYPTPETQMVSTTSWLEADFWKPDTKFEQSSLADAEDQLRELLADCQRVVQDADKSLKIQTGIQSS